jgi:hypothetical protein
MGKEHSHSGMLTPTERHDVLLEGQAVLRSLGRRELAREFQARASSLPSREELAELLLEFLRRARHG